LIRTIAQGNIRRPFKKFRQQAAGKMKQFSAPSSSLELRPSGGGCTQTFLLKDGRMLLRGEPRGVLDRLLLEQGIPV
jgi:hypothetical protein